MELSEILNHLGEERERYFNAIAPPVVQSSNFVFRNLDAFRKAFADELREHVYTRGNNPTVQILRAKIAALEGAEDALVFGSGAAAVAAAVIGNVQAGDHVVCQENPYSWTSKLLQKLLSRFGVEHDFVDGADVNKIRAALRPNTRVLYLESPNTMTFELQDLQACAALSREYDLVSIIDNSACSPIFQQPIRHGIDIVVHSATKYLNGHSDVVVGALCGSADMIRKLFESEFMTLGAALSPHDAALVLRGLRTLPLRVQRSHDTAMCLVQRLKEHPRVERVWYPYDPDFPQYDLARRQMSGAGGLFSVAFKVGDIAEMEAVVGRFRRFLMAVSWGGYESLMIPSVGFYCNPNPKVQPSERLSWNFCRFYAGLEDPEWLWEDFCQALGWP